MEMLVNFLKFCVNRQNEGKINLLNSQNNFQKFYNKYNKNKNINDSKYKEIFDTIVEAHEAMLNKKDETAMDYSEKNYNTAKTLSLTNQRSNGYNLTGEEDITKLNSAAFITTAIILEATLVLTLIISLFVLVK